MTSFERIAEIQAEMHDRGFWMLLRSPFTTDGQWVAGFTPHGASGWNGRPDYSGKGQTALEAVQQAVQSFQRHYPDLPPMSDDQSPTGEPHAEPQTRTHPRAKVQPTFVSVPGGQDEP